MDIATVMDPTSFTFDWAMDGPSLQEDDGLETAVTLSLFTDRAAGPDDILPSEQPIGGPVGGSLNGLAGGSRRGWVFDEFNDVAGDLIGSRLWLLAREKATTQTQQRAETYINEALQWMIDDGIAASIDVTTAWSPSDTLQASITINRPDGTSQTFGYDQLWAAT